MAPTHPLPTRRPAALALSHCPTDHVPRPRGQPRRPPQPRSGPPCRASPAPRLPSTLRSAIPGLFTRPTPPPPSAPLRPALPRLACSASPFNASVGRPRPVHLDLPETAAKSLQVPPSCLQKDGKSRPSSQLTEEMSQVKSKPTSVSNAKASGQQKGQSLNALHHRSQCWQVV